MIPSGLIVKEFTTRSAKLWAVTRLALSVVFLLSGHNPLRLAPVTVVAIIALVATLGVVEMRRHREHAILSGMGLSPFSIFAMLWVPPLVGEMILLGFGLISA